MKTFKRFTALVLALVMAAMLAVSAYAATVVVKYKVYVYTSQLTFKQYDYSSSTTPSTRNLTILADSSLGSGSALYHVKYVDGALAYCIQPGVRSDDSSNYVQGSSGCWYNLPASVQSGIALALACGYPSAEYGTAYGDSNSSDIIGAEKWAATQAVIWDLICEYRSPYDYRSWGSSPFYNCVDTSRYPTFALWYSEIVDAMQSATDIPSFAATSSRWCDTIELTKDTSGNYSASVTDTNGVLGDFNFANNSGNGITFTQRGNTLTITATAEAAKGLSTEKTYSATGSAYGIDPDEAVLCWYDSTGKYQSLASYTGTGLDPVRAYIKIKATVTEDKGSLTINKTDADTGKALAGVTYRLFDSAGNKIADVTTGTDGKAVFADLPLGSYSYQEISAPSGYVVDNTKYQITITASALNITATRTNALGKASVEISKVDADSNTPLQGAGFRLYDAAGSQVAEGYTDANGTPGGGSGVELDISDLTNPSTKNAADLVAYVTNAWQSGWGYVWGTYGQVLTPELFQYKLTQYPEGVGQYADFIRNNWLGKHTADCVGLIKGYGWLNADTMEIDYGTHGMPDIGANQMYYNATRKGTIDTIPEVPGLAVWKSGHIGVYIGGGQVIEAMGTKYGVVMTQLQGRGWTHWLEIPYINYD